MHYPHIAHFAGTDEDALLNGVAAYFRSALDAHGCCIIVTSAERRRKLEPRMPLSERVFWVNADEVLPRLVRNGRVDVDAFYRIIGKTVSKTIAENGARPLYAYGDLVGMLWERGEYGAAVQLEAYWNDLGAKYPFRLYCGYPIDSAVEDHAHVHAIAGLHSELV